MKTLERNKLFFKDRRTNSEFKICYATPTPSMISKLIILRSTRKSEKLAVGPCQWARYFKPLSISNQKSFVYWPNFQWRFCYWLFQFVFCPVRLKTSTLYWQWLVVPVCTNIDRPQCMYCVHKSNSI